MAVRTVSVSVQLGTEGLAIARAISDRLGYRYFDWNDTSRAAVEAGVSPDAAVELERDRPRLLRIVDRLLTSAGMVTDEVTADPTVDPAVMSWAMSSLNSSGYRSFVEDMVRELGDEGGTVIVGHGAQVILRQNDDVFRVLICGDEHARAQRLASETAIDLDEAMSSVQRSDQERIEFYKRVYGVDPFSPSLYHLTVSADLSREVAIEAIMTAIEGVGIERSFGEPRGLTGMRALLQGYPIEAPQTKEQDALRRARQALDAALLPIEAKTVDADAFRAAVRALQRVFELHVREAETPDGTIADALQAKPQLRRRADRLTEDHRRIAADIQELLDMADSSPATEDEVISLKEHAVRILVSLRLHEASGNDLLYEAYVREEGG